MCRRQLAVSGKPFQRVRIVVLGDSGTGKTTLVESLKCGYIRSLFRRSGVTTLATQKGNASPYSITERRVPELIPVLGSQPAGDVSHKPGGRLPLLSTASRLERMT